MARTSGSFAPRANVSCSGTRAAVFRWRGTRARGSWWRWGEDGRRRAPGRIDGSIGGLSGGPVGALLKSMFDSVRSRRKVYQLGFLINRNEHVKGDTSNFPKVEKYMQSPLPLHAFRLFNQFQSTHLHMLYVPVCVSRCCRSRRNEISRKCKVVGVRGEKPILEIRFSKR